MKQYIYIFCIMLAAAFTSCNNNDLVPETDGTAQQVTLQVTPDQGLNTRAAATGVDRFAIEVYSDATYITPANVFGDKNASTSTDGSFTMTLDKNKEYHCLLWADKEGSAVYNLTSLKAVTLQSGKAPVEAWQGKLDIVKGTNGTLTATLTRSVAKITLLETGTLKAGTLTMAFKQNTVFNVSTGTTTTEGDRTESISFAAIGTAASAGSKLNASDIFVLASTVDANQPTVSFQITGETDKIEVSNVPLKANYNTNIKGHYSKENGSTFTITCDDGWAGDKEGTVASPYTSNVSLPTADDKTNNSYRAKITVDGVNYPGIKLGLVATAGTYTTDVLPATGNVTLSFYAVGWTRKNCSVKITVNNAGAIDSGASKTFDLQGNTGATGASPYDKMTFTDSDFFTVALQNVTAATTLTIESLYGGVQTDGRVILTGINVK